MGSKKKVSKRTIRASKKGKSEAARRKGRAASDRLAKRSRREVRSSPRASRAREARARLKAAQKKYVRAKAKFLRDERGRFKRRAPVKKKAPPKRKPAPKPAPPKRKPAPKPAPPKRKPAPKPAPPKRKPAPKPAPPKKRKPSPPRRKPALPKPPKRAPRPPKKAPPKRRKTRGIPRDERGRFIKKSELLRRKLIEAAKKKIDAELAELEKKERDEEERKYRIDTAILRKQERSVRKVAEAIGAADTDLRVEIEGGLAEASRFEAQITVSGMTAIIDDEERARDQLVGALIAATEAMPKRRGMLVQLALVPNETILSKYGREGGLMTTRWMRLDTSEHEYLASRGREMFEAMVRNGWAVIGVKIGFIYDRRVAKSRKGQE